jgi:hypothetical protein
MNPGRSLYDLVHARGGTVACPHSLWLLASLYWWLLVVALSPQRKRG